MRGALLRALSCWLAASLLVGQSTSSRSELSAKARDTSLPALERDRSLTALARLDPDAAQQAAAALLKDSAAAVRFRAAWILADAGRPAGLEALRLMAAEDESDAALPAQALGRARDAGSHELLRALLARALARGDPRGTRARVAALTASVSEFADPKDAPLLAQAVKSAWDEAPASAAVEQLGRTGGAEAAAVAVLEEVFDRGKGWSVMAAGLGLARCGAARGRAYVVDRLADRRLAQSPDAAPSDEQGDDPRGPRAGAFLLEHLGVLADEPLIPAVLQIASDLGYADAARDLAWHALLRIDPPGRRAEILELAWKNLRYEGAARFVVVHDEEQARSTVDMKTNRPKPDGRLSPIERALLASAQERRRWREGRRYDF
jgi:hypothetical protein